MKSLEIPLESHMHWLKFRYYKSISASFFALMRRSSTIHFNSKLNLVFAQLKYRKISIQIYSTDVNIHTKTCLKICYRVRILTSYYCSKQFGIAWDDSVNDDRGREGKIHNNEYVVQHKKIAKDLYVSFLKTSPIAWMLWMKLTETSCNWHIKKCWWNKNIWAHPSKPRNT